MTDMVALGNLSARVALGLIQTLSGPFEEIGNFNLLCSFSLSLMLVHLIGVDGAWGLAYKLLSSWGGESAIDHMTSANSLYDSFSMCLTPSNPVMGINDT